DMVAPFLPAVPGAVDLLFRSILVGIVEKVNGLGAHLSLAQRLCSFAFLFYGICCLHQNCDLRKRPPHPFLGVGNQRQRHIRTGIIAQEGTDPRVDAVFVNQTRLPLRIQPEDQPIAVVELPGIDLDLPAHALDSYSDRWRCAMSDASS
ncbi:hypothetical protein, partial [Arthrobacter luteolus]|uniref:hypothetical protein n=1 Tax=Arthrobacter luteolus TaxID=98672 RepID=UPI001C3F1894